jgi:response regulator RpfG family c-di-GMP phosphodiesterase
VIAHRGTILVIEDNPELRRMFRVTLQYAGYNVLEADAGSEAVALAREDLPQLILTDLVLPDAEPESLVASLRAVPGLEHVPVIAISGSPARLDLARREGYVADALLKPVEPSALLARIEQHMPSAAVDPAADGTGQTVLVVDDDPVLLKLTRVQLERAGYHVIVAADGFAALRLAREKHPDVVISDVLMPHVDGFQLCEIMRSEPALSAIPVILISSAYCEEPDRRLAERVGAQVLIERTPNSQELLAAIAAGLQHGPAPFERAPEIAEEHASRVARQLERQTTANAELSRQVAMQSVQLSVLAGISGALMRHERVDEILQEILNRCLEVSAFNAGVLLLIRDDGLVRVADAGGPDCVAKLERRLDGEDLLNAAALTELPLSSTGQAGLVVPLSRGGARLGMLAITWADTELAEPQIAFARTIAGQITEAIALQRAIAEVASTREETIARLARAAEFRDNDTARHTERVSLYSELLARQLGLHRARRELIRVAAVMHDVGKIGVPDSILLKPGPLTPQEYEEMKRHTEYGYRILAGSGVELLDVAATIALSHHERVDGGGYPNGLAGDAIPIEGRIVAIADVFDALTSDRVYRPAFTIEEALETMRGGRGSQFDAQLFDLFIDSVDLVVAIRERHRDPAPPPEQSPSASSVVQNEL